MKYKYIHITETGYDQEPGPEELKAQIAYSFAEKLMERTTIERIEEPGRVIHRATVTVLHDEQMEYIARMIRILLSMPHTSDFGKELARELNEM